MASTGHSSIQEPQAMQSSLITYAIFLYFNYLVQQNYWDFLLKKTIWVVFSLFVYDLN
jgi:hypothetical protein